MLLVLCVVRVVLYCVVFMCMVVCSCGCVCSCVCLCMGMSTCHLGTFMTRHVYGKNHHIMIDYDGNRGGTTKKTKNE